MQTRAEVLIEKKFRWTCYICHEAAPDESIDSLDTQDKSKNTEIFVDGDFR